MAVEDHPKYAEWLAAFDRRNEAESRYHQARMNEAPNVEAARRDLEKAQKDYDAICDEL